MTVICCMIHGQWVTWYAAFLTTHHLVMWPRAKHILQLKGCSIGHQNQHVWQSCDINMTTHDARLKWGGGRSYISCLLLFPTSNQVKLPSVSPSLLLNGFCSATYHYYNQQHKCAGPCKMWTNVNKSISSIKKKIYLKQTIWDCMAAQS